MSSPNSNNMSLLVQVLPYTNALSGLIGDSFKVSMLQTGGAQTRMNAARIITSTIVLFVSVVAIIYATARTTQTKGADRAVLLGTITFLFAILLPKVFLEGVIDKICSPCNSTGKFSAGFVFLSVMAVSQYVLQWMLFLRSS